MFCLVNVDLLDYTVSQKAADSLEFLLQEPQYNRNDGIQATVFRLLNLRPLLSLLTLSSTYGRRTSTELIKSINHSINQSIN